MLDKLPFVDVCFINYYYHPLCKTFKHIAETRNRSCGKLQPNQYNLEDADFSLSLSLRSAYALRGKPVVARRSFLSRLIRLSRVNLIKSANTNDALITALLIDSLNLLCNLERLL